ncbi:hypothetical protein LepocDRAFT_00001360 [Leptothrix ochracea L12]|uniref:Uncharacterized protein n=1 Tax=Leptothrix ochracea L12 TaxID=735332 RepID=I4Z5B6_9BURK|nr:hypothetical protein [Leptothrix ochracea]EIM31408.1 hypothetical protein LepocDRAFT_00001360 [Leptothrix ochracea L12]
MHFTPMPCRASNTVLDVPDSPRSSTELYGYYHTGYTDKRSSHEVIRAINAAHVQLRALLPGLQTRLLQRAPGDVLSKITWMEIFSHPQGLSEAMIALILGTMAELPAQRLGPRVTERFVTVV